MQIRATAQRVREAAAACDELRHALASAGLLLPSLHIDGGSCKGDDPRPLIDLGCCDPETAWEIAAAFGASPQLSPKESTRPAVWFIVPATPAEVAESRRRVLTEVRSWDVHLDEDTTYTLELLVSELVSNAVIHAGGVLITVGTYLQRNRLFVEVHDASSQTPKIHTAGDDDETGRGLPLVAALARRHGWQRTLHGKRCWAELELPKDPPSLTRAEITHRTLRSIRPRPRVADAPWQHGATA